MTAQSCNLGVEFKQRAPLSNPAAGCSVPNPIAVSALSSSVKIGPEAVMNCALADELAADVANGRAAAMHRWLAARQAVTAAFDDRPNAFFNVNDATDLTAAETICGAECV